MSDPEETWTEPPEIIALHRQEIKEAAKSDCFECSGMGYLLVEFPGGAQLQTCKCIRGRTLRDAMFSKMSWGFWTDNLISQGNK